MSDTGAPHAMRLQGKACPRNRSITSTVSAVSVTATLAPGYTLGDALDAANQSAQRALPATSQTDLTGASREFRDSSGSIYLTFVLPLAFIYLVLSAQFESFINPLVIMLSVPLSITGALLALWLCGGTLNIFVVPLVYTLVALRRMEPLAANPAAILPDGDRAEHPV